MTNMAELRSDELAGEGTGLRPLREIPLDGRHGVMGNVSGMQLMKSSNIIIEHAFVVVGNMEEFNSVFVPAR